MGAKLQLITILLYPQVDLRLFYAGQLRMECLQLFNHFDFCGV